MSRLRAEALAVAVFATLALAGCGSVASAGSAPYEGDLAGSATGRAPLVIVASESATPVLPPDDLGRVVTGYALPGPGADELTVVVFDGGCPGLPDAYSTTAAANSLQIITSTHLPADTLCSQQREPYTTVVEVPAQYSGYTEVLIDGEPVDILPAVTP